MNKLEVTYKDAISALNDGRWSAASASADELLASRPDHGGVNFIAGVAALQLGRLPEALQRLHDAVRLSPRRGDYWAQFSRALCDARLTRESLEAAETSLGLAPADALSLDTLGVVLTRAHRHELALQAFSTSAKIRPDVAAVHFNIASSMMFLGRLDEAATSYATCLKIDPRFWKAYLALEQLRPTHGASVPGSALEKILSAAGAENEAAIYLHLAMAKRYEDVGEYELSFRHLLSGKSAARIGRESSRSRDNELFDALEAADTGSWHGKGYEDRSPIFVMGMPRSGTTLVDRILSSHPDVASCGELQNFGVLFKRFSSSSTALLLDAETVKRARGVDWASLGKQYVESTRPVSAEAPRFVDKLPHNFLYAGFLMRAFPNAHFICLERDPMDTCLSNFRQLFALSSPFYDYSFDLIDTGHYFVRFRRLMAHWERQHPNRIHVVSYEALLDDQHAETAKLLASCDLSWSDQCMSFETNPAAVSTASAVQVREPLNRKSQGRWRKYGESLSPLRSLLANAGVFAGAD